MKTAKELAKHIVRKLTERPEVKDADGFYNMILDIEAMERIVEKCISENELRKSEPKYSPF